MSRYATQVLYIAAMVVTVVGVDVLFFRHLFWGRLTANIAIVLVFGTGYMVLFRHR